jgi:hypothetical protein
MSLIEAAPAGTSSAGSGSPGPDSTVSGSASSNTARRVLLAALGAVDAALAAVPSTVAEFDTLTDSDLMFENGRQARQRDALARVGALLAGQVARRSAPELGGQGLAQRNGFRTPVELVKATTRATGRDAVTAVRAGTLLVETATDGTVDPATGELRTPTEPWLSPVAAAITAGQLSLAAADAIRAGLGTPNSSITAPQLLSAASALCIEARTLDPDRLLRRARQARDELDAAGIPIREEERRAKRGLTMFGQPGGGGKAIWNMDPETWATVKPLYDRSTSPKLGGVRFVGSDDEVKSARILADTRTPEQLASDSFAHLLRAGADADSSTLLGTGAPVVILTSTLESVTTGEGHGNIQEQLDPVSIATIQRALCDGASEEIFFDHDVMNPVDHGHEQRTYTRWQKRALALRDGGCLWPGCDRPPSWCEAHHVLWWKRDRGKTDLDNGMLLCRHHHLLLHNNGWEIARDPQRQPGVSFWLTPPSTVDPSRTAIPMPSKSAAVRQLRASRSRT